MFSYISNIFGEGKESTWKMEAGLMFGIALYQGIYSRLIDNGPVLSKVCGGRTTHTFTASFFLSLLLLRKYVYLSFYLDSESLANDGSSLHMTRQASLCRKSTPHFIEASECLKCSFKSSHFRRLYIYSKNAWERFSQDGLQSVSSQAPVASLCAALCLVDSLFLFRF